MAITPATAQKNHSDYVAKLRDDQILKTKKQLSKIVPLLDDLLTRFPEGRQINVGNYITCYDDYTVRNSVLDHIENLYREAGWYVIKIGWEQMTFLPLEPSWFRKLMM